LTFLAEEERSRPALREALRVEELAERNMLKEPAYLRRQFDPLFTGVSSKGDEYLALLVAQIPWEKERLRRRVNRFSRRLQGALELPFPIEPPFSRRDPKDEAEARAAVLENIERDGHRMQVRIARQLNFEDQVDLCRLRAARLQVALVLYQVEQGKTAPSLKALVPRYLDALPKDPYSGEDFHYRVSEGEVIPGAEAAPTGNDDRGLRGPPPGWYTWFNEVPAALRMQLKPEERGPGMAVVVGPFPLYLDFKFALEDETALATAGFVGLWAGPPGHNFLTPAWMLPGLDLGPVVLHSVRPGQGVLWSVGPDRVDNGGGRIAGVNPRQANAGIDLVFIVPDFVRGGNP
jgi:hypothetical protein